MRAKTEATDREAGDGGREKQHISTHRCDKRQRDSEKEREIKRGACGCQVDQNKHWVPCRQRARFSQTDTKLDPLLSSSKQQNTDTTSSVNLHLCFLFEENGFFFLLSSLLSDFKLPFSSLISS